MLPSNAIGLAIAIAALSPGYVYLAYARRRIPRADRSAVAELAAFILGGAAASGLSSILTLALGQFVPFLLNLGDWTASGGYLAQHPWAAVASAGIAFPLSLGIAYAFAVAQHRSTPPTVSDDPVWWAVFHQRGTGQVQCAVLMDDGRVVEGQLDTYTTRPHEPRDIALRPPLGWWEGGSFHSAAHISRVILSGDRIREIHVRFVGSDGSTLAI